MRVQNLTDGELPTWREGRAWHGQWRAEWAVFRHPRFAISISKGGYNDNEIQFHLAFLFFSLWISREPIKYRSFADRTLGIDWHDGCFWIKLWCDDDWDRSRAWHRNTIVLHVFQWFTGHQKFVLEKGESIEVLVPMPEGCYRAKAHPEKATWTWRFGFTRTQKSWWIEIDDNGCIPSSGKGENSWDCGDDGICGTGGETLEKAIGNIVAAALRNRSRYGHDSNGTGRTPVKICNPKNEAA